MSLYARVSAVIFFLSLFLFTAGLRAENDAPRKLTKTNAAAAAHTRLNLNNISTYIYNDGSMDQSPLENSGFEFPKGSKKFTVFKSGFLWGAKANGEKRIGGSTFYSGLRPGKIISQGKAEDPALPKNRIYRIRPDYRTAILTLEASEEEKTVNEIYSQYEKDWNEWPALDGAPFTDVNHDGKYDPKTDIPGVKNAVQTIWYVVNDLDSAKSVSLYGSKPTGMEMQVTVWAYNNNFILDNSYFKKYKLINKSGASLKEMYTALWSDPDNGDAGDDFAGCDSILGLGYCYNASLTDPIYGNRPPAIGYDMVQGPLAAGTATDSAVFDWKIIKGRKNLPVTSFFYYIGSDAIMTDPTFGSYDRGTLRAYNNLQGKIGTTGEYFPVPSSLGGGLTKFPLSGDPVNKTGYLDGVYYAKGDRRMGVCSGPFEMAAGDTQEIVYAQIAAQSSNNLASVALLKTMSADIQKQYNSLFSSSTAPAPAVPQLNATYSKDNIILEWNQNNAVEAFNEGGFKFQGYNVYQVSPAFPEKKYAVKIATFDIADGITAISGEISDTLTGRPVIAVLQKGTDSGIQRTFNANRDTIEHTPLYIGKKYYYAINAYTYRNDPEGRLTTTESPLGFVSVIFQENLPGLKYRDTLRVVRKAGSSDARIIPVVLDASKITGHDYQVSFTAAGDSVLWSLTDLKTGVKVLKDQKANDVYSNNSNPPVADGIMLTVIQPASGMKSYQVTKGSLKWSWKNANSADYPLSGFGGAMGDGYNDWGILTPGGSAVSAGKIVNTLIKFASTDTSGNILNPSDPNVSYAHRYLRSANNTAARPEFVPFIKNTKESYGYQDYVKNFPFAAYNHETGQRLMVGYLENNVATGIVDGKYWPPNNTSAPLGNAGTGGPREWFFIFDVPYSETPDTSLQKNIWMNKMPVLWFGMPTREDKEAFSSEDEFLIIKYNLLTSSDVYTYMTDYLTDVQDNYLPLEYSLSQNFPNPFNPLTTIKYSVKENVNVELKVFDILGRQVRTLVNSYHKPGEYTAQFDGRSLSSGVYIYNIKAGSFTSSRKLLLLK